MIRDVICRPMNFVIGWPDLVSARFAVICVRESRTITRVLVGQTVMLARGSRRA
jgi:hypothetical protein